MAIFSKGCTQYYNFQSPNSLMLSFTNIWGLLSWLWIFPWIKFSWHSCSMWEKPGWFWQFHCKGLFSFNLKGFLKDSTTHMLYDLADYLKKELPFAQDLSLENSADSYLCFQLTLLHSVSYFFFLYLLITFVFMHGFWFHFFYQNDIHKFTNNIYDINTIKIKET